MDARVIIPAVLISLNEGLKRYFNMPSKYAVLVNWILGTVFFMVLTGRYDLPAGLEGFLLGSAAGGLYDAKKLGRQ